MARSVKGVPLAGLRDLLPDVPVFDRAVATGARASPAPPPGRAPSWVNVAIMPPRPLGQLPAVGIADLASLALRRAYERLEVGVPGVSVQDVVAVSRLAWQVERDEAIPARDEALAELAEVQEAMLTLKAAIIRHSGQDEWRALWGEVLKELERAREIRRVREHFAMAARPVHQPVRGNVRRVRTAGRARAVRRGG